MTAVNNAEIPTPYNLRQNMINLMNEEFWKSPRKVLEPACGKGGFLLDIIDKKECKLTPDLILFLDSVRTLFRFVNKKNHDIIVYQLESKLENFNV